MSFLIEYDLAVRDGVVLTLSNIDRPSGRASCVFKLVRAASPLVNQVCVASGKIDSASECSEKLITIGCR
jgi:hypothetical protein